MALQCDFYFVLLQLLSRFIATFISVYLYYYNTIDKCCNILYIYYCNINLGVKGGNKSMNDIEYSERNEIFSSREYQIIKSNDIVLKSRYDYTVNQQKAIAYICSMINPLSKVQLEYEFDIPKFCKICGIDYNNGKVYENTRELLKSLIQKVMFITLPDGTETSVNWVQKVWTNKRSGKAKIRLDNDMIPFLFELQSRFLSYGLLNILRMKSQYSIRLYEMLKAYHDWKCGKNSNTTTTLVIDIDELKHKFMVDNIKSYQNFNLFKTRVLEISMSEINAFTDLEVNYEPIVKGRKVIQVKFSISNKASLQRITISANNQLALGSGSPAKKKETQIP